MPKLKRYWRALQKKEKQGDEEAREKAHRDRRFMANLMQLFMQVLSSIPEKGRWTYSLLYITILLFLARSGNVSTE